MNHSPICSPRCSNGVKFLKAVSADKIGSEYQPRNLKDKVKELSGKQGYY